MIAQFEMKRRTIAIDITLVKSVCRTDTPGTIYVVSLKQSGAT